MACQALINLPMAPFVYARIKSSKVIPRLAMTILRGLQAVQWWRRVSLTIYGDERLGNGDC